MFQGSRSHRTTAQRSRIEVGPGRARGDWRRVELPQALLLTMEDQARWRIENGLTSASVVPNYLAALATEPLHDLPMGSVVTTLHVPPLPSVDLPDPSGGSPERHPVHQESGNDARHRPAFQESQPRR